MLSISISCSSNERAISDPILGVWNLTSITIDGVENSSECDRRSTYTFYDNETYLSEQYAGTTNCTMEVSFTANWERISNSVYRLSSGSETLDISFSGDSWSVTLTDANDVEVITYSR